MSLSKNEVLNLFKVATAYDGRERSEPDVFAWMDSAARAAWTYEEALEAVKEHFAFDGGFLVPATVTKRVTAQREAKERHLRSVQYEEFQRELEAPPENPASEPEWFKSLVEETARKLGWPQAPKPKHRALSIECPNENCQAAAGRPCARKITRGPRQGEWMKLANCHESRVQAAKEAA